MTERIITILLISALSGGLGIWKIAQKKPGEQKDLWVKYAVYLGLIVLIGGSIIYSTLLFRIITGLIVVFGMAELIKATIRAKPGIARSVKAFVMFSILAVLFLHTAWNSGSIDMLLLYTLVVVFDAYSQISGQLFGKTRITSISPNKTWEGFAGGTMITILALYFVTFDVYTGLNKFAPLLFGSILCIFCLVGDLAASWYKRICGIKDYSRLLRGQGGVLDRYDSLIAAGAFYYLWSYLHGSL